ncbi:uncharacterized protein [Drosophila kikkawai]|uniref:Uncharacterized protein n=1 Tax=Drosophila kikkawai TaxID=30033 RepID=A0A6P4JRC5_DROKI|nr:uncharacterized protein LOC108085363 [Drosophila kikkawai]
MEIYQVQKVHLFLYINTTFLSHGMLVKVCKAKEPKAMEDCEIIGMIFEIIGDMLFGTDSSSDYDDDYDSST